MVQTSNWDLDLATYHLLHDIDRHYFRGDRQVNVDSMLAQTVRAAVDTALITMPAAPEPVAGLVSLPLVHAELTDAGRSQLATLAADPHIQEKLNG